MRGKKGKGDVVNEHRWPVAPAFAEGTKMKSAPCYLLVLFLCSFGRFQFW